jgi:hypothetical protein
MNSLVYEVEFPDGELREYAANILAENMLSQVDYEGHDIMLMRDIIDYKKDEDIAVLIKDKYRKVRLERLQESPEVLHASYWI